MISLKSKKLWGLLVSLILIISFSLCSCKQKKYDNVEVGYINSNDFKDYVKGNNQNDNEFTARIFFYIIGEESFLYEDRYDEYVIYLYNEMRDSVMNIFVLKMNNDIACISTKKFVPQSPIFNIEEDSLPIHQKLQVHSKILNKTDIAEDYLYLLERAIKSSTKEYYFVYDKPFRIAFYYFRGNYGRITDFQTDPTLLDELDALFKNIE